MKKIFILVLLLSYFKMSFGQKSDIGNWFIYLGNQKLNSKFNWHNEIQYRNYNLIGDLQQLLLRTGIGYNMTENNNNALFGYAFIHSQNYISNSDDKVGTDEHRFYQQFISRQNFGRVLMQHRYRIEERFLPTDFQFRFRYFLSFNILLNNKTMADNTLYASVYNELFLNGQKPHYDRNRLYCALGYAINKHLRIEAGFMAQTLENVNRNQFQIVIFNNTPFNKKG